MELTAKQEQFCKNIALKKMTQCDAYKDAYDAENMKREVIDVKASELMSDGKIAVRVDKLTEQLTGKLIYTAKMSFDKFEEIQDLALTPDGETGKIDLGNANKSEIEKAKLAGLYEQKVDITSKGKEIHTVDTDALKEWVKDLKDGE